MEAHYLTSERAFLRYLDLPGDEPPIVWLHGVVCSSTAELTPVAVQPVLRSKRSLLVDLLGYGYSDRPDDFDYTIQSHARTVLSLLDGLGVKSCHLVGHSFGGTVAIHVSHTRPDLVRSLLVAESNIDPGPGGISGSIAAQTEEEFIESGYRDMIEGHERSAKEEPRGISARHLGMFRMMSPVGVHRAAIGIVAGTTPPTREILKKSGIRRTYVVGELSEEPTDQDLVDAGVRWDVVPDSGHPMGLHNPAGFAEVVARSLG